VRTEDPFASLFDPPIPAREPRRQPEPKRKRGRPPRRASRAAVAEPEEPAIPPVRIVIADDHSVVRRGMRAILEEDPSFQVVGEAADGSQAIEQIRQLKPDIAIVDISMPEHNGLDVTRALRREDPDIRILILTMHFAEEVARECLRAGARAYVVKSDMDKDLLDAVRAVRDERPYFTPQIGEIYYTGYMESNPNAPVGANGEIPLARLTPREKEVVKMLCEGLSNKEVASSVGISTRTVESHRNNVMRKLNLPAFSDLVRYAVRHGVVNP
jgi:DNA-binding NarL/FixJ family response regulator